METQTAARMRPAQLDKLRGKAALVLSFHDFRGTQKLDEILKKMTAYPADFYKIVSTATSLFDNVSMMKLLERHQDAHSLVGLCMGAHVILILVLVSRAGSAFA